MIRDTIDVKPRVMTHPFAVRNHKPLHWWSATALFLAGALASSGVTAAIGASLPNRRSCQVEQVRGRAAKSSVIAHID